MFFNCFCLLVMLDIVAGGHSNNLAWNGGPLHMECEHAQELFTLTGRHVRDNVIATKAVSYKDEIYVITPRMKRGVLATVWLLVRGRHGVEMQPFPEVKAHEVSDCQSIQNAVDFQLDHLGNLWVLDTGVIETVEYPRCTCPPKVVEINIPRRQVTRCIDMSSLLDSTSVLQNIAVEYGIRRKPFVYVSDATRGAIHVHDTSSSSQWTVMACTPAPGIQLALTKRAPGHNVLIMVRVHQPGLLEMDTSALRGKNSTPLKAYGANTPPVLLLGSDSHHVYLRYSSGAEVLIWDTRDPYNCTDLVTIHSPGPRLTTTSVSAENLKHTLLVLDSNYADTIHVNQATFHRITFVKL